MSELTPNQMLAVELRKVADLIERIELHSTVSVQIHGVPPKSRQSIMGLFGGDRAFERKEHGSLIWHQTEYLFGDMELTLHHAREDAA